MLSLEACELSGVPSFAFGPESGCLPPGQVPRASVLTALCEASGPHLYLDGQRICEAEELMRWMTYPMLWHSMVITAHRLPGSLLRKLNTKDRFTISPAEQKALETHKKWNQDPHWRRMRKGLEAYVAAKDALSMSLAAQLARETIVKLQGEKCSYMELHEGTAQAMIGRYLNENKIQVVDESDIRYS